MTEAQQKIRARQWKLKAERRMKVMLRPWIQEITAEYRIGDTSAYEGVVEDTFTILRRFQVATVKDILKFDIREYKQNEETVMDTARRNISRMISDAQPIHNQISVNSIIRTMTGWIRTVTNLAITNAWTEREAQNALANYLRGQSVTIAMTEAQWITETTRNTVVVSVNEPIKNAIARIVQLFRDGMNSEARKLSREVDRLARLPLSVSQGEVINLVNETQGQLIGSEAQSRAISNLQNRASNLGTAEKEWSAVFINTRDPHEEADGQTQPTESPFVVGGQLLQHPGDSSLGASLWNIINCQCATIFL